MHSCLYEGTVVHRRTRPVTHQFQYRLFMAYLDMGELRAQPDLLPASKYASKAFCREDHLFRPEQSLLAEVGDFIHAETGCRPNGPVRLLTQLRWFGYYFSPLNLFFVFDSPGVRVEYVVAEVSNTPWNERHCYVLWRGNRQGPEDAMQFAHPKAFHVSPFMQMEIEYRWRITEPGSRLNVDLANVVNDQPESLLFAASMSLRRRALSRGNLRRLAVRYPLMTARISAAIYVQAWRLWWKNCPFYEHPKKVSQAANVVRQTRKPVRVNRTGAA